MMVTIISQDIEKYEHSKSLIVNSNNYINDLKYHSSLKNI